MIRKCLYALPILMAFVACNPAEEETGLRTLLLSTEKCSPIVPASHGKLVLWNEGGNGVSASIYSINTKSLAADDGKGVAGNAGTYYAAYPAEFFNPGKGTGHLPETIVWNADDPYGHFPLSCREKTSDLKKIYLTPACNWLELKIYAGYSPSAVTALSITADVPICGEGTIEYGPYGQPYINPENGSKTIDVDLGAYGLQFNGEEKLSVILPLPAGIKLGRLSVTYENATGVNTETVLETYTQLGFGQTLSFSVNVPERGVQTMEERIGEARLFHHLNVENDPSKTYVPSQSTIDVRYAKALGFNTIEGNVHRTADNRFVIKHGQQGTLGKALKYRDDAPDRKGDISSLRFDQVTSEWLRENVIYDSRIPEYCISIPTIEEFALECLEQDMAFYAETTEPEILPILQSILPNNMIAASLLPARSMFNGMAACWRGDMNVSDILYKCRQYGAPYCYLWSSYTSSELDNSLVKSVVDAVHAEGYLIGTAYANPKKLLKAQRDGFDWICSCYASVNTFKGGNLHNISDINQLNAGNGTYTLYDASCADKFVKVDVRIRFKGNLSISIGDDAPNNACGLIGYESDGSSEIELAIVSQCNPNLCKIFVEDPGTEILSFGIYASTVEF